MSFIWIKHLMMTSTISTLLVTLTYWEQHILNRFRMSRKSFSEMMLQGALPLSQENSLQPIVEVALKPSIKLIRKTYGML